MPPNLRPADSASEDGPPTQIDVFTGGNVRWADVKVPKGIEVVDQRLEAHGFKVEDGVVLEGKVFDLASRQPVAGAREARAHRAADPRRVSLYRQGRDEGG